MLFMVGILYGILTMKCTMVKICPLGWGQEGILTVKYTVVEICSLGLGIGGDSDSEVHNGSNLLLMMRNRRGF